MNNAHMKRIFLACFIAILVFTAIFLILPTKSSLVITAFCFALFAPILIAGTLWQLATGTKNDVITNAVFPFQAIRYVTLNLLLDVTAIVLELCDLYSFPVDWFCTIHIIILAFCAWRFLALSAAQHTIQHVEQQVQSSTTSWRSIIAQTERLRTNAPANQMKLMDQLWESVRFADPVTKPQLGQDEQNIADGLKCLAQELETAPEAQVKERVDMLLRSIKNRNDALKQLK